MHGDYSLITEGLSSTADDEEFLHENAPHNVPHMKNTSYKYSMMYILGFVNNKTEADEIETILIDSYRDSNNSTGGGGGKDGGAPYFLYIVV